MILNNKPVIAKQMPVLTSTLLRLLYLRKYDGDVEELDGKEKFGIENEYNKAAAKFKYDKRKLYSDYYQSIGRNRKSNCDCDVYFEYIKKCLR